MVKRCRIPNDSNNLKTIYISMIGNNGRNRISGIVVNKLYKSGDIASDTHTQWPIDIVKNNTNNNTSDILKEIVFKVLEVKKVKT